MNVRHHRGSYPAPGLHMFVSEKIMKGIRLAYYTVVDPYKPYSFYDMLSDSIKLAHIYRDLVSVRTIGFSVQKRALLLLTLGKGEKKALLCGSHHGREYLSSAYLMKMAEEYARLYRKGGQMDGYDVREVLGKVQLHIVPMVNPDGVEICRNGFGETQSARWKGTDHRIWKANAAGVDLNRQYPCCWEELKSPREPGPERFKGKAPASEPEVKAVMELCYQNDYMLAASFHTKGEEIYYADSLTGTVLPQAKGIAEKLCAASGYAHSPVSSDPSVFGGGFENWFRFAFRRCAFVIELTPYDGSPLPHSDKKFDTLVWNRAKSLGLVLADAAHEI